MIRRYLAKRNNPWELLAIAGVIFVPGMMLLLAKETMIALVPVSRYGGGRSYLTSVSAHGAHVFGGIAVLISLFLVFFYFYARQAIIRELEAGDDRSVDDI
jgi:hypothetical protein